MTIELYILFIMSVLTFAVFGMDKHWATVQSRRVPEALLFVLIVLDGAFGALCGMLCFRHKTQHTSFRITVPIVLAIQLALHVLCRIFFTGV